MPDAVQTSNFYCHKAQDELQVAIDCAADPARDAHLDNAAEYVSLAKQSAEQLASSSARDLGLTP